MIQNLVRQYNKYYLTKLINIKKFFNLLDTLYYVIIMKIKNSLFPSFYLLLAFCLSLHAQAPDSLVGQTITFNYQGTHESGSVSFQFLSDDGGWMYDEHGGWDQMSYEWISSSNPQFLKILFSEGDVLDANLTFFDPTQGNSSFLYLETDENEI